MNNPLTEQRVKEIEAKVLNITNLAKLIVGSCTCLTKTPVLKFHAEDCRYRVIQEAYETDLPDLLADRKLLIAQLTNLANAAMTVWQQAVASNHVYKLGNDAANARLEAELHNVNGL